MIAYTMKLKSWNSFNFGGQKPAFPAISGPILKLIDSPPPPLTFYSPSRKYTYRLLIGLGTGWDTAVADTEEEMGVIYEGKQTTR